ncbi:MAG: leucine-rich repeat protein [Algibacter sp.]
MKKILLLFITVLTTIFAGAQDFTVGDIGYTITVADVGLEEVEVQGSTLATPVVPSMVDNGGITYTVTAIGASAFKDNATIMSIELPVTVITVGNAAFQSAVNLSAVNFTTTSGITNVALRGFLTCSSLTNINDIISVLETTGGLGTNGNGAFNGCDHNGTLVTPSTFTSSGTSVFRSNVNMVAVDMSASTSLLTLSNQTFQTCTSLASVILPSNMTTIGGSAFSGCTSLTSIQVNNPVPAVIDANSFTNVPSTAILYVPDATAETAYEADANWLAIFDASRIVVGSITLNTNSENIEQKLGFSFYPNPTNGIVSIKNSKVENANVTVYDLNGRALLRNTLNGTLSEINISSLASGVYLFKVQVGNSTLTKRIIKQ